MPITFADEFLLHTQGIKNGVISRVSSILESTLSLNDIVYAKDPNWGNTGVCGFFAKVPDAPNTKIQLNCLYWPTGATRFATFSGLVDDLTLKKIRDKVGTNNDAKLLKLTDEAGGEVTAYMRMLAPYPLMQVEDLPKEERQLYLITLVDERYFWWTKTGSINPLPLTWQDLILECLNKVDLSGQLSYGSKPIPAAYLTPSLKWRQYESTFPLIIDAIATALNRRFVYLPDGNAIMQHWEDARAVTNSLLDTHKLKKAMGGKFTPEDLGRIAPEYLRCVFYRPDDTKYTIDKSLLSTGITDFDNSSGMPGSIATYKSEVLFIDNLTQAENLANHAAYDWYGWLLAPTHIAFAGMVPYTPNGFVDYIVWEHSDSTVCTKVRREPLLDLPSSGPECPQETQIIRINNNIRNPDGDYEGIIQMWDAPTNRWVDSEIRVWVKNAN